MRHANNVLPTFLLSTVCLSFACVDEVEPANETEVQQEIIELLLSAGYSDDDLYPWDAEHVMLQGDRLVGLSLARAMAHVEEDEHGFRATHGHGQYYGPHIQKICVGIGATMWSEPNTRASILASVADFNNLGLRMSFEAYRLGDPAPSGCFNEPGNSNTIRVQYDPTSANWPDDKKDSVLAYAGEGPPSRCSIWFNALLNNNDSDPHRVRHTVSHEIGHCLGLAHEDWDTKASCFGTVDPESAPADEWSQALDAFTIMLSCGTSSVESNIFLSNGDLAALEHLYPKHPNADPNSQWCGAFSEQTLEGDFDGDGITDRLCHDVWSGRKWLDYGYNGYGLSELQWYTNWCSHEHGRVLIADVDGDAKDDVVCHDHSGRTWYDLSANGLSFGQVPLSIIDAGPADSDWTFSTRWCSHHGSIFEVRDVDGDNLADFICSNAYDDYRWIDFAYNGRGGTDWEGNRANEPVHVAPAPTPHPDFCQHPALQLEQGHFDGDIYLDYLCHHRETGYKWIDWGHDGYSNDLADLTHWNAQWCWLSDEHFFVGDADGDDIDDFICHSETGAKWIDYGHDGFAGNGYTSAFNFCGAPGQFSISDKDNDGRVDFVCNFGSFLSIDYAYNGFGPADVHTSP